MSNTRPIILQNHKGKSAIGRDDGSMVIHDLRGDDDNIIVLRDHASAVTCMSWSGEDFFVSTGRDAILSLWRIVPVVEEEDYHDNTKKRKKKKKQTANLKKRSQRFNYRRIQSIPVYEQVEGMVLVPSEKHNELRIVTAFKLQNVQRIFEKSIFGIEFQGNFADGRLPRLWWTKAVFQKIVSGTLGTIATKDFFSGLIFLGGNQLGWLPWSFQGFP